MGDRLHPIKCIKVFETHFLQFLLDGLDLIGYIVVLVRVAADRDDRSAQLLIQAQDVAGWCQIVQPVLERGRIDLDPFAVRDDLSQNFFDDWLYLFKRIRAVWIIAHDHVHMGKHAVVFEGADKRKQLVVVAGIVLLLAFLFLIILIPELFVVDLMDRQQDKIKRPCFIKLLELADRMGLDPEFKSFSDRNLFFILVFQRFELFEVARIIVRFLFSSKSYRSRLEETTTRYLPFILFSFLILYPARHILRRLVQAPS